MDRLHGLDRAERAACLVAERVLEVTAEAWDTDGRQGAVDAMLTYANGRRVPFEVTKLAGDGALQAETLLSRDQFAWPLPGNWWWSVKVGSVRDLPRLRQIYPKIVELCESAGVPRPDLLWRQTGLEDADVRWLTEETSSSMWGHPDVPARDGDRERRAMVTLSGRGGAVDKDLKGLSEALLNVFAVPYVKRHFNKLSRVEADERHLFLAIHYTSLPFSIFDGLATGAQCPIEPAPIPPGITHLWLAPQFGRRVLFWSPGGWRQEYPYDDQPGSAE